MKPIYAMIALLVVSCASGSKNQNGAEDPIARIPKGLINFVSHTQPNRTVGQPGHQKAFEYIQSHFQSLAQKEGNRFFVHEFEPDVDFAVRQYEKDFKNLIKTKYPRDHPEYMKWRKFTDHAIESVRGFRSVQGRNLILEVRGTTKAHEVLYVGAHYDTITHNHETMEFDLNQPAPGADDNASGIAVLLALAELLSQTPNERTLRFVAFDFEEIFFLGSYALAGDIKGRKHAWTDPNERLIGLFNLEMLGWSRTSLEAKPVVKIYTRTQSLPHHKKDFELAEVFKQAVIDSDLSINPVVVANDFNRSDNWSFWQHGYPAICITQDWEADFNENNYHTSQDLPDRLNFPYLQESAKAVLGAVQLAANPSATLKKKEQKEHQTKTGK